MDKIKEVDLINKSIKNILIKNKEIIKSFNKNQIQINLLKFFVYKIISRLVQRFKNPPK